MAANINQKTNNDSQTISNTTPQCEKRKNYLSWEDYFMGVAFLSAKRSKDPGTQVGACVVSPDHRIVGIGYNGFPIGCSDDLLPWSRESEKGPLFTKYPFVCHAEMNAILNTISNSTHGCTLYTNLFPCCNCAKITIQAGIKEIVYCSDKYHDEPDFIASRMMYDMVGVKYRQYIPTSKSILIEFNT